MHVIKNKIKTIPVICSLWLESILQLKCTISVKLCKYLAETIFSRNHSFNDHVLK